MANKVKYSFCLENWDQETRFTGDFDSIADALEEASAGYYDKAVPAGTKIFIGENVATPIPQIDVEKLFEDIGEKYYDEFGEIADDYLSYVKKEHAEILSDELNSVFSKWLKKYHYLPWFYKVDNIKTLVYDGEKWNEQ